MFKNCTIDNLTIILGNKHQQETNNFGNNNESQDSEGDVCEYENDRFVKFDSYDDDQRTEIISLLDELEDIEFFWSRELFQPVWELWVLPEQFGSIYHKIHSPVEVKEFNKDFLVLDFPAGGFDRGYDGETWWEVVDTQLKKYKKIEIEYNDSNKTINIYEAPKP